MADSGNMADMLIHATGNGIYRSIVEHATEAILLLDKDSLIHDANHRAISLLGYSREDLLGKHLLDLMEGESREEYRDLLADGSVGRDLFTQVQFRRGDGTLVESEVNASYLDGHAVVFCRDISQRKVLEEELRNLASAVRASADAVFITDTQGMIYFTNPAFERLTGYTSEEALGRNPRILNSGQVTPEFFEHLWSAILAGRDWRGELTNRRKNGEIYEADVTVTPIKDEDGQVISFLSVQRDITHRKRLERQLEEYTETLEKRVHSRTEALSKMHEISELLHSVVSLDKVLQLILIAVTAGDGFRFNRAFLLLVDENEETISGKLAIGPSTPEEAGRIWHEMSYLPKRGNLAETLESYLVSAEDENFEVNRIVHRLSASMSDESSIVVRAIKERRGFNVVNGHAHGFSRGIVLRYPGSGHTLQMDQPPAEVCDLTISRHLGNNHFAVVPLLWREGPVGCLIVDNLINREAIADASLWVLELFAEQAALAIINARMVARLERDKYRIQSAYRDLKDSKDKLVEAQTMAALGRMAATVAHEIRTPIVAIGGFAKRLSHDIRDRHAQRMLDIIRSEALRLEETLDMVLFYVKPSQPQRKECNVNELLETLSLYFAQEASEMHIEMVFQLDPNLPQVPLDDRQIRQVILNVIQNSIHAMQDGGILTIHTHPEGDWVVLEIIDTGCGIPEENIPSIFKEFFTTKNKGTGLGLHVSYQIVKNHGGKIEVESQMNQGTTVRIRLPLHPGPPGFEDGDDLGIVDERR